MISVERLRDILLDLPSTALVVIQTNEDGEGIAISGVKLTKGVISTEGRVFINPEAPRHMVVLETEVIGEEAG